MPRLSTRWRADGLTKGINLPDESQDRQTLIQIDNTPSLLRGAIRLDAPIEGVLTGGWIGPKLHLRATAEAPLETIEVRGY